MKLRISIYLCIMFYCGGAWAVEIDRDTWIDYMKTALPIYQCQSDKYFRQCFTVKAEKCEKVMASATRSCLEKEQANIPEVLNQPEDGTKWGSKVGSCAGIAYEMTLSKERTSTTRCNNVQNWK